MRRKWIAVLSLFLLLATSCGGKGDNATTTTSRNGLEENPSTTTITITTETTTSSAGTTDTTYGYEDTLIYRDKPLETDEQGEYFKFSFEKETYVLGDDMLLRASSEVTPKVDFYEGNGTGMHYNLEKWENGEWVRLRWRGKTGWGDLIGHFSTHYPNGCDSPFRFTCDLGNYDTAELTAGEYRFLVYFGIDGRNFVYYIPFTLQVNA